MLKAETPMFFAFAHQPSSLWPLFSLADLRQGRHDSTPLLLFLYQENSMATCLRSPPQHVFSRPPTQSVTLLRSMSPLLCFALIALEGEKSSPDLQEGPARHVLRKGSLAGLVC